MTPGLDATWWIEKWGFTPAMAEEAVEAFKKAQAEGVTVD